MKIFFGLLFLVACFVSTEDEYDIVIQVETHRSGIRTYDSGVYAGHSPVTITRTIIQRNLGEGIKRWFMGEDELHPGESFSLNLETFYQGVRTPLSVRVPFDPTVKQYFVKATPQ